MKELAATAPGGANEGGDAAKNETGKKEKAEEKRKRKGDAEPVKGSNKGRKTATVDEDMEDVDDNQRIKAKGEPSDDDA